MERPFENQNNRNTRNVNLETTTEDFNQNVRKFLDVPDDSSLSGVKSETLVERHLNSLYLERMSQKSS